MGQLSIGALVAVAGAESVFWPAIFLTNFFAVQAVALAIPVATDSVALGNFLCKYTAAKRPSHR